MAQAIASRMVLFPAPLGPMMPVRPGRKWISLLACWRKLRRRREFRRISAGLRRALDVLAAQLHQPLLRDPLTRGRPPPQPAFHLLLEGEPAHGRARRRPAAYLGRARVEVEVQRLGLPL